MDTPKVVYIFKEIKDELGVTDETAAMLTLAEVLYHKRTITADDGECIAHGLFAASNQGHEIKLAVRNEG